MCGVLMCASRSAVPRQRSTVTKTPGADCDSERWYDRQPSSARVASASSMRWGLAASAASARMGMVATTSMSVMRGLYARPTRLRWVRHDGVVTTGGATVRIGSVELGSGRPKVCVPLTGATLRALQTEAEAITPAAADLVELRIDRFADLADLRAVRDAIDLVDGVLPPAIPLLLTCRTSAEGGGADLAAEDYRDLLLAGLTSSRVAAVDVEMALPRATVDEVVADAHAAGRLVVMSFHDLEGTPSQQGIVDRLLRQQALGADVVKLACTPHDPADVLTLLAATHEYALRPDARPAIKKKNCISDNFIFIRDIICTTK